MTTTDTLPGADWLACATAGGLPEPTRGRWQPLRVGIVNLWEYDDAEFWFADGRLVLRGGNGAGKTKVLELTTLMLLRGEVIPAVLDPFGSQTRTMRYNLLPTGEADDPRPPSDSGLGYAWAEFGRRDEAGDTHFFVCGLGASARRGTGTGGVAPWQVITGLRPGKEFQFSRAGRPLDRKELRKLDGVTVLENARNYRARLASELFGLDTDAFDNLTELLKRLRKPKLGEGLNTTTLAATLRDALPPLAANEVEQLAEGWDRLEKLRQAVDATKEAARQVAGFTRTAWLPWVRIVVRSRADAFTSARTKLDNTTRDKVAAERRLAEVHAEVARLDAELTTTQRDHEDADTALRTLLESRAYQDAVAVASRVDELRRTRDSLRERHWRADREVATRQAELLRRAEAASRASERTDDANRDADTKASVAAEAATPAGLGASAQRHLTSRDFAALRADAQRRADRLARLRELASAYDPANRAAELSAQDVSNRQETHRHAGEQADDARRAVEDTVDTMRQQIREWAAATVVATCTAERVEDWCDRAAELTETHGEGHRDSPAHAIYAHAETAKDRLRARRVELIRTRDPVEAEHRRVSDDLAEVERQRDRPPPEPSLWRRADRPGVGAGRGAPLWQCVEPRPGLPAERLDTVEASLAAAGLLDAWLSPDGRLRTRGGVLAADASLHVTGAVLGDTLNAVLAPTPTGGVTAETITAILAGIGWHSVPPRSTDGGWLAGDGSWRLGVLAGRAEPSGPAAYLGATARAAARRRRIEALRSRLAELAGQIEQFTTDIAGIDADMSTVDGEIERIPSEEPVSTTVATWRERIRQYEKLAIRLATARVEHQKNETRRDSAWAAYSTFAGEHGLPLRDLDSVAVSLNTYRDALGTLELAHTTARHLDDAASAAVEAREYQAGQVEEATAVRERLADELRQATVRLRTAAEALGTDHATQLTRRSDLDATLKNLAATIKDLTERLTGGKVAEETAKNTLSTHEERRTLAERERDDALTSWWEAYDIGLAAAVGLAEPDRRVVETGRTAVAEARKELAAISDEHAETRALRRCHEKLLELKHELLPTRDTRVRYDPDGGSPPRFLVLAHSDTGWQAPDDAAEALAVQVREQEAGYDAEQQQVLATLLGSTFIEHLKDRLDYTQRIFAGINAQLAAHPTRPGHVIRLRHEADPAAPDASAVVAALSQGYQQLSPVRQEMVRSFLTDKIDEARDDASADGAADWKEQLAAALDYRRWLRISLEYRPGSQAAWRPFDRAQHGAKSGGEKVVLLSQPLFSAAVVAFDAASERAPRWVWLDEAMTGVDERYKASFMGLTVDFDLDVMLTAHDEWCTYPTVPAVAVYDLARQHHLPGVDAQPHLWCGGELTEVVVARPTPSPTPVEGLFAEPETPA